MIKFVKYFSIFSGCSFFFVMNMHEMYIRSIKKNILKPTKEIMQKDDYNGQDVI